MSCDDHDLMGFDPHDEMYDYSDKDKEWRNK